MTRDVPIAILAGVSLGSYQRNDWRPERYGWSVKVLPGKEPAHGSLRHIWKGVLRLVNECADTTDAGIHLLLAHDREDERPPFRRDLRERSLRTVWLHRSLSGRYGTMAFRQRIQDVLEFEEQWRRHLRPGLNSPLLLPESAFEAEATLRDTWERARDVAADRDDLEAVGGSLDRFSRMHKMRADWLDSRKRRFGRGPLHGTHDLPAWQRQKLGFRLPDGFHFDVSHERGRRFQLEDQYGIPHEFVSYTNVDPHGFIRGGY